MPSDVDGRDDQDGAEAFDEDTIGLDGVGEDDGGEMKTFEELPDVLDVTAAAGDADDDEALIAEDLDDDQIIELSAEQSQAEGEDDDLETRFDDAATPDDLGRDPPRLAEESRFDLHDDDGDDAPAASEIAMSRADDDNPELAFTDDTDEDQLGGKGRASRLESRTLSDDDLKDLGYQRE